MGLAGQFIADANDYETCLLRGACGFVRPTPAGRRPGQYLSIVAVVTPQEVRGQRNHDPDVAYLPANDNGSSWCASLKSSRAVEGAQGLGAQSIV